MSTLLVLHHGAIGDFLLTLPVIQSIRSHTQPDRVIAVASAPSARLAAGRSVVDAYVSPDAIGLHSLFQELPLHRKLQARSEEACPLAQVLSAARVVVSFLTGAEHIVHRRLGQLTAAPVISVDPRPTSVTLRERRHISVQWTEAIRGQGLPIPDPEPAVIRGSNRGRCDPAPGRLDPAATRRILIHPGSGGRSKCWPADRFAALAGWLSPAVIRWMFGPAEVESEPQRFLDVRRRASLLGEPLFVEPEFASAAERIEESDVYLGNDAGMTHLAAALGLRTVVIFGPTDPAVWRPLGTHVAVAAPSEPAPITRVTLEQVRRVLDGMASV